MIKKLAIGTSLTLLLNGCVVINDTPCEDIVEVKKQERMCADLRKTMNMKDRPQIASAAKERYEQACVNLRYYRDDYDTICKNNEKPVGKK